MTIQELHFQEPPFALQIELVEGCNLRCPFCGINGIRDNQLVYHYLEKRVYQRIVEQLRVHTTWNPRIEFAMHGEPSLHPNMIEIVSYFRDQLPHSQLMMTSNGTGFLQDPTRIIDEIMQSLNVLAIDHYEHVPIGDRLIKRYQGKHPLHYYPEEPKANPHVRRKSGERLVVIVEDIRRAKQGTHSVLNNHAGCAAPRNHSQQGKRCAKPFREMSIRWDGSVAICCNDWRGTYNCGDILSRSLEEIWQGAPLQAARRKLYHGQRDFGPCDGCDARSYRTGLLPDKMGKQSLPHPTSTDQEIIQKCLSQKPLSLPVLRDWELS